MSDYERNTALDTREVRRLADEVFSSRIAMRKSHDDHHGVGFEGDEGKLVLELHRHGHQTSVTARTDQLRTSRLDNVVRFFLNQLPYQPGDPPRARGD